VGYGRGENSWGEKKVAREAPKEQCSWRRSSQRRQSSGQIHMANPHKNPMANLNPQLK